MAAAPGEKKEHLLGRDSGAAAHAPSDADLSRNTPSSRWVPPPARLGLGAGGKFCGLGRKLLLAIDRILRLTTPFSVPPPAGGSTKEGVLPKAGQGGGICGDRDSDGSCCSSRCSIGRGLHLVQYRPRQEAGSRGDSDGSCCSESCSESNGRGLRLKVQVESSVPAPPAGGRRRD